MILEEILEVKRAEVAVLKKDRQFDDSAVAGLRPARNFGAALTSGSCPIIAEVKRKSPSKGVLREDLDPVTLAAQYERSGAAAISVLTDRQFFSGSAEDLRRIKDTVGIPVLRKDFIIDPCQVYESRMIGADAVLLIARILDPVQLKEYIELAASLGMAALVEIHDRPDAEKALASGAGIIGINNRDLSTFATDVRKTIEMLRFIPKGKAVVSESGIKTRMDILMMQYMGVHAFLVGEELVKAEDPGLRLRDLMGR